VEVGGEGKGVSRDREGEGGVRKREGKGVGPTCPTSKKPLKYILPRGKACK